MDPRNKSGDDNVGVTPTLNPSPQGGGKLSVTNTS